MRRENNMSIKIEIPVGDTRPVYIEVPLDIITTDENGNDYDNKLPLINKFTSETIGAVIREYRDFDRETKDLDQRQHRPAKRPREEIIEVEPPRPKRVRVLSPMRPPPAPVFNDNGTVAVTLRNRDHERRFNLKPTWKLKRALKTFAEEAGVVLDKQRLHWVGMGCIVDPSETVESVCWSNTHSRSTHTDCDQLQLQDGDQVDVLNDTRR